MATIAANPTIPCAFSLRWPATDQYQDPWADLELSLNPGTRDRHAYVGGNPVANVDPSGHFKLGSDGSVVVPAAGCGLNYNCGSNTVRERGDNGGCGCTWTTAGPSGNSASISYGGKTVQATVATVRVLRQGLIDERAALAGRLKSAYSYLEATNAACDSAFDRWFGATCQAYQQGATNALHRLDRLSGQRVGFTVKPATIGSWIATTSAEELGGGSASLGWKLWNESTNDPIYAVGKTVYGAKLVATGTVLSGAGIAVDTIQDGTNGFARSSISVAVSAGVTAAASSSRYCGKLVHPGASRTCSFVAGATAGIAASMGYDEVREVVE